MKKLTNKILKSISEAISFALDDFDDNELQGQVNSKVKGTTKGDIQKLFANKQIT